MLEDQCSHLLPNFGPDHDQAVFDGQCLLKEHHDEKDHLVYLYNPFGSRFMLWRRDEEGDDGSEDFRDYLASDLSGRKSLKLIYKSWGNEARAVIAAIKKGITRM